MDFRHVALASVALLAISGSSAHSQSPIELKLGTFHGPQHPVVAILREHAEQVSENTEGRLSVRVFDSGTLAGGPATLNAVQRGVMDIGNYVWTYAPIEQLPLLTIGGLPYVYRDGEGYAEAWEADNTLIDAVNAHVAERGYDNVFFSGPYFSGFARIGFRNYEPRVPDDLRDLKIRGTGTYNRVVEAYGAVDVTIESPEVYNALESGLIDGAVGLAANWINWSWMEPSNYLLNYPIAPVGGAMAVNAQSWERVSEEDQAVLIDMIAGIQRGLSDYYIELESTQMSVMEEHMTIYTPDEEEAALWAEPRQDIINWWLDAVGEEEGRIALEAVERHNQ
ncbi:MAG: TRAP transporter substrate-binding protein DctP [Mesorhizobium sp.]|nr:TRAP transporter substrate-binding protein DctP [Mesorhizobium sp.]